MNERVIRLFLYFKQDYFIRKNIILFFITIILIFYIFPHKYSTFQVIKIYKKIKFY